ncbi:MAG: apolipoprotein N-acyltransferase [Armatimonadota bacterium]|nr:apolipoprotein N-acyltransferase [Armatimonadota bacterium]
MAIRLMGAVVSGLLLWAAFPPLDRGALVWVALVPLLWSLRGTTPREAFRLGYTSGAVWFALTLFWITLFGIVPWALLAAFLALYTGGFAALLRWMSPRSSLRDLLLVPLLWTAVETVRSTGPLAFPWALLGVSQHRLLPLLQLAALGGVSLVSFAVALGNAAATLVLVRPGRMAVAGAAVAVALALGGGVVYGTVRLRQPLVDVLRVAVLQPNIPPLRKGDAATQKTQMAVMAHLVREARARGAELIVFPETAVPLNLFGPTGVLPKVAAWAPDRVVVATSFEAASDGVRNSAVVMQDGVVQGSYAKRRLVPFGEAGVTPGERGDPIPTRAGYLSIAICYESAFAEIARRGTRPGAGPLVVVTNDGWFGTSAGPAQHAAYAALRAVETGRPVARAANTGISMIVDPLGRVRAQLPLDRGGWLVADVPASMPTPYLAGGWMFAPAVVALAVLLLLPAAGRALREAWQEGSFRQLVYALAGPGLLVGLQRPLERLMGVAGAWVLPVGVLLAARAVAGRGGLAFRPRRAPLSALLGLAIVGGLGAVMISGYGRYGFLFRPAPPPGGWLTGGALLLLGALAWEGWLRGAVFTSARAWRGTPAALVLSTLPPLLVLPARPPEVLIWSLLVGGVFGLIRLATGDVLGLALPRAAGLALLGGLTVLR